MTLNEKQDPPTDDPAEITPAAAEFLNTLPLMLRVCDAAGRNLWFSRNWLEFTGRSLEDELGDETGDIHPDDVESLRNVHDNLASRVLFQFRMRCRNGRYRQIACTATPRLSVDGEFLGFLDSCLDVQDVSTGNESGNLEQLLARATAQLSAEADRAVRAEADVRAGHARERVARSEKTQTERQFQILVQGITDYAIFLLDLQGNIITWNMGAQRIKGYTADEIIGRNFSIFYTEEDRAAGRPAQVLATAAREGRCELAGWRVRKDGSRFWAHIVVDAIYDENGNITSFAKITRDLTARRAAEIESNQLRVLIEGVKDYAIYLLDRQGNVSTWNPGAQRNKGYAADEIIGRHFSTFYTDEDRAAGKPEEFLETAAREGRFETEGWRVRKDGTRFWANVVIDAIRNENGELVGFAKITRDLTERREVQDELNRAREQLFQLQKMETIGQLTGGLAHDFNNLLTIIIGNVDMACRVLSDQKSGGPERARRLLGNALSGAKRAASLTQRLLAFARRQPLEPKAIDVNRFIANMGDFLTRSLGAQFHVEAVTGGSLWKIEADQAQLESAILNIALNARDAMLEGGKLTIEAANTLLDDGYAHMNPEIAPGQYVAISVTDTGTGMTPEVVSHVFEPFFTTKSAGQGTGLGLAQVYGFVRQSGGNVKIYSEPGEGTMVKIYLPRLIDEHSGEDPPQTGTEFGAGGETILVVEDDPAVLDYVTEVLKELNYQVLQATEGISAIKILESDAPEIDLLLTDVIMPGMSGRVVADEAKRLKPGIKVLFMTGYSQNAIVHQGRLDPGVHLIQKPVTPPELASRVRDLLDQPVS